MSLEIGGRGGRGARRGVARRALHGEGSPSIFSFFRGSTTRRFSFARTSEVKAATYVSGCDWTSTLKGITCRDVIGRRVVRARSEVKAAALNSRRRLHTVSRRRCTRARGPGPDIWVVRGLKHTREGVSAARRRRRRRRRRLTKRL